MANRQVKQDDKRKEGKLITIPLRKRPIGAQITIHINNLLLTYPRDRQKILKEFKRCLGNNENLTMNFRIQQIINFYGKSTLKRWFKDVYNWDFKQEKVS